MRSDKSEAMSERESTGERTGEALGESSNACAMFSSLRAIVATSRVHLPTDRKFELLGTIIELTSILLARTMDKHVVPNIPRTGFKLSLREGDPYVLPKCLENRWSISQVLNCFQGGSVRSAVSPPLDFVRPAPYGSVTCAMLYSHGS